jgi:hypothetical protein
MKSWLDVSSDLQAPNDEQEVMKRGFDCQTTTMPGILFPVGGPLDLLSSSSDASGKQSRRMMLCELAIGRAFPALDEKDMCQALPPGYDSYYWDVNDAGRDLTRLDFCKVLEARLNKDPAPLQDTPPLHTMNEKRLPPKANRILFCIKNSAQVLPRYIVEFEFDPKLERQSRQVKCPFQL